MTTQERGTVDYYAVLGVPRGASQDDITASYRALARALHPDARPHDPASTERFKRVTAAYRVLGDADARRSYDSARRFTVTYTPPRAPAPATPVAPGGRGEGARVLRTRRAARWAVAGGAGCLVLGLLAAGLVVALQRHDAALRRRGEAAAATVVDVAGERRLEFTTATGERVRAPEPVKTGSGKTPVGEAVDIRYDPDDPTRVITTEDTAARDITLWIVAVKLLIGGAAFLVVGLRRLHTMT